MCCAGSHGLATEPTAERRLFVDILGGGLLFVCEWGCFLWGEGLHQEDNLAQCKLGLMLQILEKVDNPRATTSKSEPRLAHTNQFNTSEQDCRR